MSYQIVTDSCCDFTREQYEAWGASCVPLRVNVNGQAYANFSEPDQVKAFYSWLRSGGEASTAAANPQDWADVLEPIVQRGEDALVLCFSSGLSATYQSAVVAARELEERYPQRRIRVVDTLCAALGQGFLVRHASEKKARGMGLEELTAWAEENKGKVCHWVTVDDLSHLRRGGRITAASAVVGTMLHVKPIIHLDPEGRLVNTAKVRGRKAALQYLAGKVRETAAATDTVFIAHGDCPEDAAALEAMIRESCPVEEVCIGYVGPVIGAHTGPGVLAVFFWGEER